MVSMDENEYEDDFESEWDEIVHENNKQSWKSIQFSEITLGNQIGGGGVGLVYRGTYNSTPVAIKTLFDPRIDAGLKQEYMDELLILSKLNHPNIVELYGASMEAPNLCFVMELCDYSLYHVLHQTNIFLSTDQILNIAYEVASAMKYLHELNPIVIHRDLKSMNILIDSNGIAKLCDFGLVCTKITTAGTPCYMPPELLLGKPFSRTVDVYMFGVLLWEMFSREMPFQGFDLCTIKKKVIDGERPKIPRIDCPIECQELIQRCWQAGSNLRPHFDEVCNILFELRQHSFSKEVDLIQGGDTLDSLLN